MRTVVLVACGGNRHDSAVGARIAGFAQGLGRRRWRVEIEDFAPATHSRWQDTIERNLPRWARTWLDASGFEGDVMPAVWWRARKRVRAVDADIAVVSVPPFSLLAATLAPPADVPLVLDYRDPWSAREQPHSLGRATRWIERSAAHRASAITYAGYPRLGEYLSRGLRIPAHRVTAVQNGFDPRDLVGLNPQRTVSNRNGTPLDLVFVGHWYGRNGPGILSEALAEVGAGVVRLSVFGSVSPSLTSLLPPTTATKQDASLARPALYQRLSRADAAVVTVDHASAIESRIPAKVYDYLAVGVPVIAVCPATAALLSVPGGQRFHHFDHRDVNGLACFLRRAADDRSLLRTGPIGDGPVRDAGVAVLHHVLLDCLKAW